MKLSEAKEQFIQDWGILASSWGISRTMGQAHAFLLLSTRATSADEIMKALSISRGNCNQTVRELIQWRLVYKTTVAGDRKEYFKAEKDIWKVAQVIARERRHRELDPLTAALSRYAKIEGSKADVQEFQQLIQSIQSVADIAGKTIDFLTRSGLTGFLKGLK